MKRHTFPIIRIIAAGVILCSLTAPGFCLDPAALAAKQGKWTFSMGDAGPDLKTIPPEKLARVKGTLQDISKILTATPAMSPPKGFEAKFWGTVTVRDPSVPCTGKDCRLPVAASLALMIGRYEDKKGSVRAAFNTPSTLDIAVNNLGHIFAHLREVDRDDDGPLFPEPAADGTRAGMPAFRNNGHAIAVLARDDRPLWQPVSRERYLKAAIATARRLAGLDADTAVNPGGTAKGKGTLPIIVEEVKTWTDPKDNTQRTEKRLSLASEIRESAEAAHERLRRLQAELDAMTPEQRALPARIGAAWNGDGTPTLLPPEAASTGIALVAPHPGYFDAGQPLEAPQLITVQWKFDGNRCYDPDQSGISGTLNNLRLLEIYRTADWDRLRAKIIPRRTGP